MVTVAGQVLEGKDVVLLLDSITRLSRAYNNAFEGTGRTLSGGARLPPPCSAAHVFGAPGRSRAAAR